MASKNKVYSFDANICISAKSEAAAVDSILEHCVGEPAHIAVSLHKEGTLKRLEAAEAKLEAVGELQRQSIMCYSMNPNALQITAQDDGDFILYADVEAALKDKDNEH